MSDPRGGMVSGEAAGLAEDRQLVERVFYVAECLLGQVPEFTGVIGPAGEREDDYIRGSLARELRDAKARLEARLDAAEAAHAREAKLQTDRDELATQAVVARAERDALWEALGAIYKQVPAASKRPPLPGPADPPEWESMRRIGELAHAALARLEARPSAANEPRQDEK